MKIDLGPLDRRIKEWINKEMNYFNFCIFYRKSFADVALQNPGYESSTPQCKGEKKMYLTAENTKIEFKRIKNDSYFTAKYKGIIYYYLECIRTWNADHDLSKVNLKLDLYDKNNLQIN